MREITVSEIYKLTDPAYTSMPESTALDEMARVFAHEHHLRAIFLVDSNDRFSVIIRRIDLMRWLYLQLFGRVGGEVPSPYDTQHLAFVKEARDLARGDSVSMGVKPSNSLQTALDKMITHGESIIPVLDDEHKILGDIRASSVLTKALEVWEQEKKP
ncbi:MAG: CBS domain-containing protein [Chloroflexota bacterium]|nr:CBS domain-containing protein [Chloroflexota bacterium]